MSRRTVAAVAAVARGRRQADACALEQAGPTLPTHHIGCIQRSVHLVQHEEGGGLEAAAVGRKRTECGAVELAKLGMPALLANIQPCSIDGQPCSAAATHTQRHRAPVDGKQQGQRRHRLLAAAQLLHVPAGLGEWDAGLIGRQGRAGRTADFSLLSQS